jgi:hypothetical protein
MTRPVVARLVYRYIGVSGGYLGDFSYSSHSSFYPEYCDLDIDPFDYPGTTTRERFLSVISSITPRDQANVIRGVIERFPVGAAQAPETRTAEERDGLLEIAARLERHPGVPAPETRMTSDVVDRALTDAERLIETSGPTSAVDRVHTALHGYVRLQCRAAGVSYEQGDSITALLRKLRAGDPRLQDVGPRADEVTRVLNSFGAILDAMNTLRNQASVAHANEELLEEAEAHLVVNAGHSILAYLDARLSETP